ncbi:HAD-IIIA family hydrolase [Candidatus Methylacidithermus pantelleriae]|uniref:Phosphoheptose isomerase n=1 Tax=Candidatus Methylacidithermus pantelleriae TaxID=2744239 RepID=A0A8J2FXF8_9BACT|nr:HAD-IIIA family hydrolase [Candidatus Methylacidithermus pantelleriae]CAF0705024.1 Phosphoheptose isomerase [Candidatus Methylacidithermus pantelleriae]
MGSQSFSPRRFVVLDRDGTLIAEKHYLSSPSQLEFLPNSIEALHHFRRLGLGLILITNQSGIARGFLDWEKLERIHRHLEERLQAEGLFLQGIYVCPHGPEDGCACRKPKTALLERAAREHGFNPEDSFVIGDKASDIQMGQNVGATTILVTTGYGKEVADCRELGPDHVAKDLAEAARFVEAKLRIIDSLAQFPAHPGKENAARRRLWQRAQSHLLAGAQLRERLAGSFLDSIVAAASMIGEAFRSGHRLLLCGNGGSAADCQHMAAELVGRLCQTRLRGPLPALALTTDSSVLTALANDNGFETIFERQVEALGKEGDILLAISTSGSSPNILRAVAKARSLSLRVIALTSERTELAQQADLALEVPGHNTQLIQELHLAVEHLLCFLIEEFLFPSEKDRVAP